MRRFVRGDAGDYSGVVVDMPTDATIRALWGAADDDVWAVGDAGAIVHWDGTSWTIVEAPAIPGLADHALVAVWGWQKDELWIAGEGLLAHKSRATVTEASP